MPLAAGDKLGPYEILTLIGAGGMGEVYKALDPRLNREVAIKVSHAAFTERFAHEARSIAALNHPNVCTLYDVVISKDAPNYLVMEYVEGESPKGPMPLDEALRIANQIAAALEAAHEKNIVHRDLKPANIKIKPDGTVKVLDFGLAKQTPASAGESHAADSPTLTIGMTEAGMILGTAAYMAPEQARGKPVDRRADIWSFGVVLYEMITGKRLFEGDDVTDTLAAVLRHEPDWEQVPLKVRRLLQRCLEKDPAKRLRDIGDRGLLLSSADERHASLSPDGRWLAYASDESGRFQVYVRAFPDKGGKWPISNSGGAYPVWSRNGHELFFRTDDNRIMVANYTVKGDSFAADKPRLWSEKKLSDFGLVGTGNYDLAPDGKRVVAIMPAESAEEQPAQNHLVFLLNFADELRRRVPAASR